MEGVVLHRVGILGLFSPKHPLTLHPNMGQVPPPHFNGDSIHRKPNLTNSWVKQPDNLQIQRILLLQVPPSWPV